MNSYYRPLAQTGAFRADDALPLVGSALVWFDRAERIARGAASDIVSVAEIPDDICDALTRPRAEIAGLDMGTPALMGVLNTTPDSFSDGGRFDALDAAVSHAQAMAAAGADILDIGGESTRPGAAYVDPLEEIARTAPVIRALRNGGVETPISIDTRKAQVARAALDAGANMLNDVSALSFDAQMAETAVKSSAPICLMHAQGDPKTMQDDPHYENVLLDVYDYLESAVTKAVASGIARERIILDPGIGFGKTQAHNLALIRGLSLFHGLGCPILLGVSRKRFIGAIAGEPQADKRGPGSVAVALHGLSQAVQIIRAHDISEHAQAFALWRALLNEKQD
ncbi:MAG: dihydropteroate synthase [Litoreibacter sp.]|nr:dihydropteroate synthase [Litoreibacter sp.]